MSRKLRLLVALLALGLAATASVAPAAGRTRRGTTIPWGLENCNAVIALIPVTADSIQQHLPRGFTPMIPESVRALLPPDPRLEAVFGLEALKCERGTGIRGSLRDVDYGSIWTFVEPPPDLADPDYPISFFKWDTLIPDKASRRLLSWRGVSVSDGSTDFASWSTTPLGIGFDVTVEFDGEGTHRFVGAAGAPTEFQGSFVEFSPARRSISEWRAAYDADVAYGGTGVVEMEPASFAAETVGEERAQAYFLVTSGLTFAEASITIPR